MNRRRDTVEHDMAERLSELRAARITAGLHLVAPRAQPIAQERDLRRFANSVNAVETQEHRGIVHSFRVSWVAGDRMDVGHSSARRATIQSGC
jgi:hypothetical protein